MKNTYQLDGYKLHIIKTNKFKNITMSCKLASQLTRETATIRTLLSFIISSQTKEFPTTKLFSRHLENMYGARLSSYIATKGQAHVINLSSVCINQEYLPVKEDLLVKQIRLFKDVLLNPNLENGLFDQKTFEIKKKELKERLRANNDDKFMYSVEKLYENMGKGQHLGISGYGYIDEVDEITNEQLGMYFNDCVNRDEKHIYVVGNVTDEIIDLFKRELSLTKNAKHQNSVITFKQTNNEVNEIIEQQNITQAKLNMGYAVECNYLDNNHTAFSVFNAILGGFSQSKLFKVVREQHSLCYYVSSSYDAFNGTLIINAGIEPNDYNKAKDLIIKELEKIQSGNVTEEDLELTKKMLRNSLNKVQDDPASMITLSYNRDLTNKIETNEDYLNKINKVTIEDVIRVSKLVKLDTIFLLTGGDTNE